MDEIKTPESSIDSTEQKGLSQPEQADEKQVDDLEATKNTPDNLQTIREDIERRDKYGTTEEIGVSPDGKVIQSKYIDSNGETNFQSSYLNDDGVVEHTTLHPTGFISDPDKDYQNNILNPRSEAGVELHRNSDVIQEALDSRKRRSSESEA